MNDLKQKELLARRIVADLIDVGIALCAIPAVAVLGLVVAVASYEVAMGTRHLAVVGVIAVWMLNSGFRAGRQGQSVGKQATGLALVTTDGSPLGGKAIARAGIDVVLAMVCVLPFVVDRVYACFAATNVRKLDELVGTAVVERASVAQPVDYASRSGIVA
jgi:uncharacterized RDD family membrane protein YckC